MVIWGLEPRRKRNNLEIGVLRCADNKVWQIISSLRILALLFNREF